MFPFQKAMVQSTSALYCYPKAMYVIRSINKHTQFITAILIYSQPTRCLNNSPFRIKLCS